MVLIRVPIVFKWEWKVVVDETQVKGGKRKRGELRPKNVGEEGVISGVEGGGGWQRKGGDNSGRWRRSDGGGGKV